LGQFERKLKKDEIGLSLQCDKEESAVLVAWHIDFLKERQQTIPLDTDFGIKEMGKVRYTSHFKIFQYSKVPDFRKMIFYAIKNDIYDHTIFKTPG